MKKGIYRGLYRILSYLSDRFDNRYLIKYKVLSGTSLLILTACQIMDKHGNDKGDVVGYDSGEGIEDVSCYLPAYEPEELEEGDPADENYVYRIVEEMPEFPGGTEKMQEYIFKKIRFPDAALEKGIYGIVALTIIVERDGSLNDIEIVRGVDPDLDKEAIRIVKGMPKWKPGKQSGKEVRVKYVIPVRFRLPC